MDKSLGMRRKATAARVADFTDPVSRRSFVMSAAGMGVAMGMGFPRSAEAKKLPPSTGRIEDCSPAPLPIPGGFPGSAFGGRFPDEFFHVFLPQPGLEPSSIFHFKGDIAIFDIHGTGTETLLDPNTSEPISQTAGLPWAADVRFMDGRYVGADGRTHRGTFGFY